MTKKKVTAPLTYNPGKGRPKEHLAYLNYQEMQALKRLNGNNMERGPKGLPSFPPSGTTGKSSSSTGARGPTGPQGQARTSPAGSAGGKAGSVSRTATSASKPSATQKSRTSGPSSSLNAPSRTAPSASISRPSDTGGRSTTSRIGSAASAQRSISRPSDTVGQKSSASVSRISGGTPGGNQKDAQFRAAAESRSISKAANTPALKNDVGRSAIGGISRDRSAGLVDTSKIRGAIQGVKDLGIAGVPGVSRVGVPTATIKTSTARQFPSLPTGSPGGMSMSQPGKTPTETGTAIGNYVKSYEMAKLVKEAYPNIKESVDKIASMYNTLSVAMPGEAYVTKYGTEGIRDLSKVATNMLVRNLKTDEVLSSMDTLGLRPGTEKFRLGEKAGGEGMGVVPTGSDYQSAAISEMEKGIRGIGVSPAALDATNFWAAGTRAPRGPAGEVSPIGEAVRGTQFGVDPIARKAVIRRNVAAGDVLNPYVDPFRAAGIEKTIAGRTSPGTVVTPASATPERDAVPGLIQYPGLDRPEAPPPSPPTAGRSAVVPTTPERSGYLGMGSPVVTDPRVGLRPSAYPAEVRRKQIYDRITPEYARLAEDPTISGRSVVPSPEQSIYRGVLPRGMSFTPGLPERMPDVPIPRMRPEVQGPPRPIRGMSFTGTPGQMFVGAEVPYRPYDMRSPEAGISAIPVPASTGILPDVEGPPRPIGGMSFTPGLPEPMPSAPVPRPRPDIQGPQRPIGGMSFTPNLDRMTYPKGFIPVDKTPTPEMVRMMRSSGPFVTTEDDPEGLRYKEATKAMGLLPGGYPERKIQVENAPESGIENVSVTGGLGMVPFESEGSVKRGIMSHLSMDEREKILQRFYEGERKMTTSQEEIVDDRLERADKALKAGEVLTGMPPGSGRLASKAYQKSVKEKINKYINASPEERLAMEKSNPEIIAWANIIGEPTISDYQDYKDWAEKSGLRAPPERRGEGGGNVSAGIASLGGAMAEGGGPSAPEEPSTPSGRRPDIYYMWDLGVNIPSPSDPNYTQYQAYLAERLAAQQAMGYV